MAAMKREVLVVVQQYCAKSMTYRLAPRPFFLATSVLLVEEEVQCDATTSQDQRRCCAHRCIQKAPGLRDDPGHRLVSHHSC